MTRKSDAGRRRSRDFEEAARRFQETVEDLAARAGDEMGERAATFLDDAADRLRGEREDTSDSRAERSGSRRRRRRHRGHEPYAYGAHQRYPGYESYGWRSRKLYLDDDNGKIVGVCGGIANYFGMEGWVVRCIAVTGLIFMPQVVFPAYWVAFFVMDHAPEKEGKRKGKKRRRRGRTYEGEAVHGAAKGNGNGRRDHTAPAPEMGMRFSPRRSLRAVQDDFVELELRLRRIETHVTSGQFELQRELGKIAD